MKSIKVTAVAKLNSFFLNKKEKIGKTLQVNSDMQVCKCKK